MKKIQLLLLILNSSFLTTGCIEETFPTSVATKDQIEQSSTALESLANATAAFMNAYGATGYYNVVDFGYGAMMLHRETMLDQIPISKTSWDYFNTAWGNTSGLYGGSYPYVLWIYYYKMINNAHSVISAIDPATATEQTKSFLGLALGYRALAYMDLTRMFEYKKTGVQSLDNTAEENKIWGLTVPIITEKTTELEGRNCPRVLFYQMNRFIMNDLNRAEEYLNGHRRSARNMIDQNVIYGFKARVWLELATRFNLAPEDLTTQVSHEDDADLAQYDKLGIVSAKDCYDKAILYARKAMEGYSPVTKDEWHSKTTGFNKSDTQNSWILSVIITPNGVASNYENFIGHLSPEASFGIANAKYNCYRMINKRWFDQISDSDWRKTTWIDPKDAGKAPGTKYQTLLSDAEWKKAVPYTGFKFRPGTGNTSDYRIGAASDIPVMRVEEMYFILAEATAHTEGIPSGAKVLEDFINTYRYTDHSFSCGTPANMDEFNEKLIFQKRIEFWGEGILYFDYKRLKLQVLRGYTGTNFQISQRYNSIPGYVAPWCNICIRETEQASNQGLILNPDPSKAIPEWSE